MDIEGKLHEFSEMGGRGTPVWTVAARGDLYRLKSGDLLTIFGDAARKNVVWQGEVDLVATGNRYPEPDLTQAGVPHSDWRDFFGKECPVKAQLKKPEKIAF